jgi:hypothetical protein
MITLTQRGTLKGRHLLSRHWHGLTVAMPLCVCLCQCVSASLRRHSGHPSVLPVGLSMVSTLASAPSVPEVQAAIIASQLVEVIGYSFRQNIENHESPSDCVLNVWCMGVSVCSGVGGLSLPLPESVVKPQGRGQYSAIVATGSHVSHG